MNQTTDQADAMIPDPVNPPKSHFRSIYFLITTLLMLPLACAGRHALCENGDTLQPKPVTGTPLIDLSDDAREIKEAFNKAAGRVRLILFVSPTCSMCRSGARAVQQKVLDKIDSDKLVVFVVWIPILKPDDRDGALKSMKIVSDQRAIHFWDPTGNLGTRVANDMVLPGKTKIAWDLYLVYDAAAQWKDKLPVPADWMHQLGGIKDERRLDGDKLRTSVETLLKK